MGSLKDIIVFTFVCLICSCSVPKHSRFTSNVQAGLDTTEVLKRFGTPYKAEFHQDDVRVRFDDWYYKENLYLKNWYEVTTILHFKSGKLQSVEQGKEKPLFRNPADYHDRDIK